MDSEVVIVADAKGECFVYDLEEDDSVAQNNSDVPVAQYKLGNIIPESLSLVGHDYLVCAQTDEPAVQFLSTSKRSDHKILIPGDVSALAVSNCGSFIVVALGKNLHVWEVKTGSYLAALFRHLQEVTCIRFTSDNLHFITGGKDCTVIVWSLFKVISLTVDIKSKSHPRFTWMHHKAPVEDIFVSALAKHVATTSWDKTCKIYQLQNGKLLTSICLNLLFTSVTMDILENVLVLGAANGTITKINVHDKMVVNGVPSYKLTVTHKKYFAISFLSINADGTKLLSGAKDGSCKLWNVEDLSFLKEIHQTAHVTYGFIAEKPSFSVHTEPEMIIAPSFQENLETSDGDIKFAEYNIPTPKLAFFNIGCSDKQDSQNLPDDSYYTWEGDRHILIEAAEKLRTVNSQLFTSSISSSNPDIDNTEDYDEAME